MIPVNLNRLSSSLRTWSSHPVASSVGGAAIGYAAAGGNVWAILASCALFAAYSQERRKQRFIENMQKMCIERGEDTGTCHFSHGDLMKCYHDATGPSLGSRLKWAAIVWIAFLVAYAAVNAILNR